MPWMFTAYSFVSFQLLWEKLNPRKRSLSLNGMGTMRMVQEVHRLGEGPGVGWKCNFEGFHKNSTHPPLPATSNLASPRGPGSSLGRVGSRWFHISVPHYCELTSWPRPGNNFRTCCFWNDTELLASGGSGTWIWPLFSLVYCVPFDGSFALSGLLHLCMGAGRFLWGTFQVVSGGPEICFLHSLNT